MPPKLTLTRGQKILALVGAAIIALYVTGVATQQDGSGDQPDPSQHALVETLGGWFGEPDRVAPHELSAPCLTGNRLTIKNSCVVTVAPSDKDLRELRLRSEKAARLTTRAPHDDTTLEEDLDAGADLEVAVDGQGADITLTCDECVIVVGD